MPKNSYVSRPRITVVGSANVDLTFRTSRLPLPGETLAGQSLHQGMGGKGANQAVVAARLGADVSFIAKLGDDGFGQQALDAYTADGIDVSFVQRESDCPTGTAAIMVDDDAENCIIVVAGANAKLTADDVQSARAAIEQSDAVLCQLETPVAAAIEALRIARAAGVRTVLTPAPAKLVTDELLSLCDVCVPNRTEIAEMVGQSVRSDADASSAAEALRKRGVKQVALTLGGDGVLVLDDSGMQHVASHEVDAVDTTGAGDSFTGALAVSLSEGLSLVEAARKASIVAAISVTRMGTQTSFPTHQEVRQWLAE